jgi:hypothetical protein
MKIQIGVIALSLMLFASIGYASETAQSDPPAKSESEATPPPSEPKEPKEPNNKGGAKCRSQAEANATAVDYCETQLACSNLSPPQTTTCSGQPGRWICQCK